jgi:hypothetical protein
MNLLHDLLMLCVLHTSSSENSTLQGLPLLDPKAPRP